MIFLIQASIQGTKITFYCDMETFLLYISIDSVLVYWHDMDVLPYDHNAWR